VGDPREFKRSESRGTGTEPGRGARAVEKERRPSSLAYFEHTGALSPQRTSHHQRAGATSFVDVSQDACRKVGLRWGTRQQPSAKEDMKACQSHVAWPEPCRPPHDESTNHCCV